jgi:hypothetical protein
MYEHTQRAPLHWLLYPPAIFLLAVAWTSRHQTFAALVIAGVVILLLLAAFMFQRLTVRDEGDGLGIRFGPIPAFGTRIPYSAISSIQKGRSSVIDGWGIHWIPGRGTTYNLWGFGCAVLVVNRRVVRVGSDDVDGLIEFLKTKVLLPDPAA